MGTPLYAAIIGIDGSGKSTCFRASLKALSRTYTVMGIGDRVLLGRKGGEIAEFDKVRWGSAKKSFRSASRRVRNPFLYKMTKLMELICWSRIQKEVFEDPGPEVILGDGAPLINIAGWGIRYRPRFFERGQCVNAMQYLSGAKKIPLLEAPFYMRNIPEIFLLNTSGIASFPVPDTTFFLRVTPEVALERIMGRGEKLQVHETLSFLEKLQNAYELICDILDSDLRKEVHAISVDELSVSETVSAISKQIEVSIREYEE